MHGRGGREADGVADLPNGRWIAVRVDVLGEELPDLLLSCRQHRGLQCRGRTYVRQRRVDPSPDDVKSSVAAHERGLLELVRVLDGGVDELEADVRDEALPSRLAGRRPSVWRSCTTRKLVSGAACDDGVVGHVRRRAGLWSVRPLEIAETAPVFAVVPAVVGVRLEDLASSRRASGSRRRPAGRGRTRSRAPRAGRPRSSGTRSRRG